VPTIGYLQASEPTVLVREKARPMGSDLAALTTDRMVLDLTETAHVAVNSMGPGLEMTASTVQSIITAKHTPGRTAMTAPRTANMITATAMTTRPHITTD
jgi:hypothetical protein